MGTKFWAKLISKIRSAFMFCTKHLSISFILIILLWFPLFSQKTRIVGYCRLNRDVSQKLDFSLITDLIGATLSPNSDGSLNTNSINNNEFQNIISKAKQNNVNVFIMIAGKECNAMASNSTSRANFVSNITQFCLNNEIQGVDMDWEQPNGFTSTDRTNYTTLLKELDESLSPHNLLLTMAGGTWSYEINREGRQYLDWLNIMAYDMGKPDHATMDDAYRALKWWRDYGFELNELNLGVPFYGTNSSGVQRGYADIIDENSVSSPDEDIAGGYHYNGVTTIKEKTQLVLDSACLGVMIWELSLDKFNHSLSLLNAINEKIEATTVSPKNINNKHKENKLTNLDNISKSKAIVYDLKGRTLNEKKSVNFRKAKGLSITKSDVSGNKVFSKSIEN